ncbi:MAG: RluA family pseudouridine synthase [Candidatus Symbiothrix sp.]|jgi:23S rRNA pseudouridine1911/1915/1917 synthase|nr:RluA family pseudouridine synthase [Candidatus Symbiothrix sp.]
MKSRNDFKKDKQTTLRVKEPMELMVFLGIHFNGKSHTALKAMLSKKQVCVNGTPISQYNHPLRPNDSVTINTTSKGLYELKHPKVSLVYEDDEVIVIEKAEGLLAVATDDGKENATAFAIVSDYLKKKDSRNRLFIVHRIDRETSGLMLFAKNKDVQMEMQDRWHEIVTERVYIAVVEGVPAKEEDTIVSFLRESKALKMHAAYQAGAGKQAVTHYRIMRKNADYAMLKVELATGRKNQIRVHMQEIGHPIIGDKKYGGGPSPIGRIGLHARVLAFIHPVTHENLRFETPVPRKFSALFVSKP